MLVFLATFAFFGVPTLALVWWRGTIDPRPEEAIPLGFVALMLVVGVWRIADGGDATAWKALVLGNRVAYWAGGIAGSVLGSALGFVLAGRRPRDHGDAGTRG